MSVVLKSTVEKQIHDLTEQDLVNLRRTIYLTIMSSAGFEECAHKLMKLDIQEGYEMVSSCNSAAVVYSPWLSFLFPARASGGGVVGCAEGECV